MGHMLIDRRHTGPHGCLRVKTGRHARRHLQISQEGSPALGWHHHHVAPQRKAAPGDLARLDDGLQLHPVQRMDRQPRRLHDEQPNQQQQRSAPGEAAWPERHALSTVVEST